MATTRITRRELHAENLVAADRARARADATEAIITRALTEAPFSYAECRELNQRHAWAAQLAAMDAPTLRLQVIRFLAERQDATGAWWGWGDVDQVEDLFRRMVAQWQAEQRALAVLEVAQAVHGEVIEACCTPEEEKAQRELTLDKADAYFGKRGVREASETATADWIDAKPLGDVVVKINARQSYVVVLRRAWGESVYQAKNYHRVTPASIARLRRLLDSAMITVPNGPSAGSWRADLVIVPPAPVAPAHSNVTPNLQPPTSSPQPPTDRGQFQTPSPRGHTHYDPANGLWAINLDGDIVGWSGSEAMAKETLSLLARTCVVCSRREATQVVRGDAVCNRCAGLYDAGVGVVVVPPAPTLPPDAMLVNNKILTGHIISDLLYGNSQTRATLLALTAQMTRAEVQQAFRLLIRHSAQRQQAREIAA